MGTDYTGNPEKLEVVRYKAMGSDYTGGPEKLQVVRYKALDTDYTVEVLKSVGCQVQSYEN